MQEESTNNGKDIPIRRSSRLHAKSKIVWWFRALDGCEEKVECTKRPSVDTNDITASSPRRSGSEKEKQRNQILSGPENEPFQRSTSQGLVTTKSKRYATLRKESRAKGDCVGLLPWGERRRRTFGTQNRFVRRSSYSESQYQHTQITKMQVDKEFAAKFFSLIPKYSGRILGKIITGKNIGNISSGFLKSFESPETGSYLGEQGSERESETQEREDFSVETEDQSEPSDTAERFYIRNQGSSNEQLTVVPASPNFGTKMTVEWGTLPEDSTKKMLPDTVSRTPPFPLIQERSITISSQEMTSRTRTLISTELPGLLPSIFPPESCNLHYPTEETITQREGSFRYLLSQVLNAADRRLNFLTNEYSCNSTDPAFLNPPATESNEQTFTLMGGGCHAGSLNLDVALEYLGNSASLNSSSTRSNEQILALMPADRIEDPFDVSEGGECVINQYNGSIQHLEEICKKTRLSTLRNQIRANGESSSLDEWREDLDLNKDPPQKNVKRKKHRAKVLRERKPKKKSNGRKTQAQASKETTAPNDGVHTCVREVLAGDINVREKIHGSLCPLCDLSTTGIAPSASLKRCECFGGESQAVASLSCWEFLDKCSANQIQICDLDALRDQNIENTLDSQKRSLCSIFLKGSSLSGCLCASPVPASKSMNISTAIRRSSGQGRGTISEEGVELSLQLDGWGNIPQTTTSTSCLQTGGEQNPYPRTADDIVNTQHWGCGSHTGSNVNACMSSTATALEDKSVFSNQLTDGNTIEGVIYHDFMGCNEKLNSDMQPQTAWLAVASQSSNIKYGQLDESPCKLLLGPPYSGYNPQSEVSHVSSITNSAQPIELGMAPVDNECRQIVPYNQNREIVLSTSMRRGRKKPRAKVHLDEETNRVWLLLENGGALPEEDDQEKARIWEKERTLMKGRVDTFIKLMHVVQGDRRFSQWKGSIVDSIVGAFLTQNVSDHLSSSAFMSLASKFPASGARDKVPDLQETGNVDQSLVEKSFSESQSVILEAMHLDLFESHAKNDEALLQDVRSCTGSINSINDCPFISSPLEYSPLQLNLFTGSRTEASQRVRRRLNFEQNDGLSETHQTLSIVNNDTTGNFGEETKHLNDNKCVPVHKDWSLYQEQLGCKEMFLTNPENGLGIDSQLENTQKPNSAVLDRGKGKKRLYQVSRISGIERARIEVSQGGYKKRRRDWESLRRQVSVQCCDETNKSTFGHARKPNQQDAINWEAIRLADIEEVADAIKERGMHNVLSGRIKAFLTRLHEDHGSLDLEWIRNLSVEDARDYLLDIRGLGIKSVECIRLLTLHHLAFPVDTNVGRICVRLGWVPIEPLPEELQLHLLELYPIQETIQKYLWPRLCTLDQRTLYELHYQMITFGKVFCTKSKPNCNSCPLRADCKHFASAFASSKLLLTASSMDNTVAYPVDLLALPAANSDVNEVNTSILGLGQSWGDSLQQSQTCEPIIEEPTTPEHEHAEDIHDIEDLPYIYSKPSDYADYIDPYCIEKLCLADLPSEVISFEGSSEQERLFIQCPSANSSITSEGPATQSQSTASDLTSEGLACQSQSTGSDLTSERELMQSGSIVIDLALEKDISDIQSIIPNVMSNAIVPLPLESAYIPVPKLKNIGRLRTIHYVYEIPDNHPLINKMDAREKDDPCFYLLAIWSPDEVPQSPEEIHQCCKENFCISPCRATAEQDKNVKGTLLIPCRTATRGSFPLNGTFFQVNEVFADHESSLNPLEVPRSWLWNLRRRFVYFGTSVPNIFRGLSTEEIRACFWLGHVCVRGFDRYSRAPKPLVARLHFPASKQTKAQRKGNNKGIS